MSIPELFEGPNIAHVATLMPDGSPHSVPMWVGVEDGAIAFLCSPGSRKARNLERVDGDAAWEIIDRISHKYTGGPYPLREDRVVYLVAPEHAWEQAYG